MMNMTRETMVETLVNAYAQKMGTTDLESIRAYFEKMTDGDLSALFTEQAAVMIKEQYAEGMKQQLSGMTESQIAALLTQRNFPTRIMKPSTLCIFPVRFPKRLMKKIFQSSDTLI